MAKQQFVSGVHEYDQDPRKVLLKKKKRLKLKKKTKRALIVLVILAIVGFLVTDLSKVHDMKVKGVRQISKEYVLSHIKKYKKNYYFLLDTSQIEKTVQTLPLVKKVEVSKSIIGNVTVDIQEASEVAYAILGNKTYILDEAGHVFLLTNDFKMTDLKKYPKITGFTSLKLLNEFAREYLKLPNIIRSSLSDVIYDRSKTEHKRVRFIMDNGKTLVLRIDEMASELSPKRFNYQGYMTEYAHYNVFSFENGQIYMK